MLAANDARRFNELYNRLMTSTKNKLTVLTTVYPPVSSADAVRLMRVPAVEEMLRTGDFYTIGPRATRVALAERVMIRVLDVPRRSLSI